MKKAVKNNNKEVTLTFDLATELASKDLLGTFLNLCDLNLTVSKAILEETFLTTLKRKLKIAHDGGCMDFDPERAIEHIQALMAELKL